MKAYSKLFIEVGRSIEIGRSIWSNISKLKSFQTLISSWIQIVFLILTLNYHVNSNLLSILLLTQQCWVSNLSSGFSVGMVFNRIKNIFSRVRWYFLRYSSKSLIKLQTRNKHHPLIWYNNINPFHIQHMMLTKKPQNQALFLNDWPTSVSLTFNVLTYFQKIILCALLRLKI